MHASKFEKKIAITMGTLTMLDKPLAWQVMLLPLVQGRVATVIGETEAKEAMAKDWKELEICKFNNNDNLFL